MNSESNDFSKKLISINNMILDGIIKKLNENKKAVELSRDESEIISILEEMKTADYDRKALAEVMKILCELEKRYVLD